MEDIMMNDRTDKTVLSDFRLYRTKIKTSIVS